MCFVCDYNVRPRCKSVHFHLCNLKPETFLPRSLIISGGRSRADSIWAEVVDHESISPFGNKFDIRLEVRTQNGSVVKKKKKKKSNAALFAIPTPISYHCSNFFFWSYRFSWLFPYITLLPPPFHHLPANLRRSTWSYETHTNYTYHKKKRQTYLIFSFYKIRFLPCQ